MFERLSAVEERYEEVTNLLCDPDVISDTKRLRELSKEQSSLEETVTVYREYKSVVSQYEDAKAMQEEKLDDEMREMVKMEIAELAKRKEQLEDRLKILLLPKDPNDDKNVIVEIRGAAGGDEAALFASDLFRMYTRYAERHGFKVEVLEANPTDIGGYKEIVFSVSGRGAYSKLKFESGAHRVQRIPATESGGRIHTSTSTVLVLPEAEDVEVEINEKDIRIDTFCSSGAGGQSVNTTKSAVRVTHIPTGIVVSCQDEKSQHSNKDKALRVLRARLYDYHMQQQMAEQDATRKSLVGTGDRSERIRTYNFPQSRVTDHRIGLTLHRLEAILEGEIDEVIENLMLHEQTEQLKSHAHTA
ncbi:MULTISPECIES: peptide chain release factor 1 [Brevibacillus]|uniref:Peptide chain release factor 1 n=1 Tax=Brevibacillus borstelensis AK1 TaxID=1300222 RepID=M8D7W3_9BACL|nr:peptide chain release factor 1 [Brevibacillus borstelensis]EMT52349.1 peptide chain release factor 1 [Brevibacillus borstelensis AK1]KKX54789.1 peptide chain release factor 1 [Brevibacillus borstelensis cifa_chp40]MBE5396135.1 peptide chain release factor 1 [Brevibacillus borstelensis]MCC0563041.1 peptide chain release factor 1 [Brevibacillus borstelensis]MCM3468983.1 peptide chain release factor 1 [Brevibacillus borstelensis]